MIISRFILIIDDKPYSIVACENEGQCLQGIHYFVSKDFCTCMNYRIYQRTILKELLKDNELKQRFCSGETIIARIALPI